MEQIGVEIKKAVKALFDVETDVQVTVAPEEQGADYATNIAMKLAGILKAQNSQNSQNSQSPQATQTTQNNQNSQNTQNSQDSQQFPSTPIEIATQLKSHLESVKSFPFTIEIAGPGFLNFISQDEYWQAELDKISTNFPQNISLDDYRGQTVICEFSDPNPFKVLHIGHLYTSVMGDSISRLIEFAGGKVIRANFGGDVGLHVAKTLYAMQQQGITKKDLSAKDANADEVVSAEEIAKKVELIARCYVEGTRAYEDDEVAKSKITELNKLIYVISEENLHDSDLAELYWAGRELSYRYFENFYASLGITFNKYYPESTVVKRGKEEVKSHIGSVYQESEGAIVFLGERYGLHTRVFINKEGVPTYETKDVGLIFTKYDDWHFDKSIIITGNEQKDYMRVVLKSIEQYAPELVEKTTHITHGLVKLPGNEKMSSRKGNFVKAVDVLDAIKTLVPDYKIALGAIKYAFLKYKIGGNIEFDIKESVSTTGNSGVYLQYSAVRAKKILAGKFTVPKDTESTESTSTVEDNHNQDTKNWHLEPAEKSLIRKLTQYQPTLKESITEFAPHKIATYLYELAQEFSRFYESVKVNGSEYEAERREIVKAYLDVMTHGLNLLGIAVPEEM